MACPQLFPAAPCCQNRLCTGFEQAGTAYRRLQVLEDLTEEAAEGSG